MPRGAPVDRVARHGDATADRRIGLRLDHIGLTDGQLLTRGNGCSRLPEHTMWRRSRSKTAYRTVAISSGSK